MPRTPPLASAGQAPALHFSVFRPANEPQLEEVSWPAIFVPMHQVSNDGAWGFGMKASEQAAWGRIYVAYYSIFDSQLGHASLSAKWAHPLYHYALCHLRRTQHDFDHLSSPPNRSTLQNTFAARTSLNRVHNLPVGYTPLTRESFGAFLAWVFGPFWFRTIRLEPGRRFWSWTIIPC